LGVAIPSYATLSRKIRELPTKVRLASFDAVCELVMNVENCTVEPAGKEDAGRVDDRAYVTFSMIFETRHKRLLDLEVSGETDGYGHLNKAVQCVGGPDACLLSSGGPQQYLWRSMHG
jgi:hypothetical protein